MTTSWEYDGVWSFAYWFHIKLSENTIQDFENLYDLIGRKTKSGVEVTADLITKARNEGYAIEDIKNYLK